MSNKSRVVFNDAAANLVTALSTWGLTNVTRTAGQTDPDGGTNAYLLNATIAAGFANLAIAFTANGVKVYVIALKAGSAAISALAIWDNTVAAYRHRVSVTWAAGVPTLATVDGGGQLFEPVPLADSYYILAFSANGVIAANANVAYVYPAHTGTGTVLAYAPLAENSTVPGWTALQSDYPSPGSRFGSWVPLSRDVGDSSHVLSDESLYMFRTSQRFGASFEVRGLGMGAVLNSGLDVADRLCAHLLRGKSALYPSCSVFTEDALGSKYLVCGLAPGAAPEPARMNSRVIEYSLALRLINLATSPAKMVCHYA